MSRRARSGCDQRCEQARSGRMSSTQRIQIPLRQPAFLERNMSQPPTDDVIAQQHTHQDVASFAKQLARELDATRELRSLMTRTFERVVADVHGAPAAMRADVAASVRAMSSELAEASAMLERTARAITEAI